MTWTTRFMAVPTGQLKQDEKVELSAKATPQQMRAYMSQVSAVYDRLRAGAGAEDFQRMRASGDPQTRAVGDAYHHLFSPAGADHRLEAEIVEGKGLVVTRGRHRIDAAREIGLAYVPVHVRAADERTLDAATRRFEDQVGSTAPGAVVAQRQLNAEHREARSGPERSTNPGSTAQATDRAARASQARDVSVRAPSVGPGRDRSR